MIANAIFLVNAAGCLLDGYFLSRKGHDKELENTVKQQLLQSEKDALTKERLVREASQEPDGKKSKSRRKREAKQRRMKGSRIEVTVCTVSCQPLAQNV